ncbi:MAG: type II toxin-antitoxin system Phd/YefM family antitoxin [Chloroflexia bacterium]|nr:type II toxin-antitoxin system Phd/YefM family antitoxin [Chloroflexia bacterium]
MKIASVADIKARLSAYLKASEDGLVVITRNGKAIAALVPIDDDEELERLVLAYSKQFQQLLQQARSDIDAGHGIDHDTFWATIEE